VVRAKAPQFATARVCEWLEKAHNVPAGQSADYLRGIHRAEILSGSVARIYSAPYSRGTDWEVLEYYTDTGEEIIHVFFARKDACRFARRMMAEQVGDGSQG